ncbi:PQQ-binding-like beta-propeller repeat protein [bacterium]|nr:PQQ-binding-like beta-propeller repeat protein [bacterium]
MANKEDWPTYRNDTERSGYTQNEVKADLHPAWKTKIGGKLSSVIVAGGKLFVAAVDTHTIHALDAASGKPAWTFTAGGRVDSPPTYWQGRLYFGSKDGYVYCLRASNGELVWRFRAAPMDRRLVAFEQLESAWPVHGSVLILDAEQSASGKAEIWCAAGRSMFLDGGLRLLRLDAETGTKLDEKIFDDTMPEEDENLQALVKGLNMPVALNDILSSDGKHVFMRSQQFDKKGERAELANPTRNARDQQGEGAHLFAPTGFLDDAYWHRSYWVYGKRWKSGAGGYYLAGRFAPSGRMLVFDEDQVYGFSREPEYFKWTTPLERKLYSSSKKPKILRIRPKDTRPGFKGNRPVDEKIESQWAGSIPLYVQAMVLADNTLFVAGPRDLIDENKTLNQFEKEDVQERLTKQDAVIAGEEGSMLCSYSAKDGRELSQLEIDAPPVWDGMAAARGHIFLALKNGSVACLKPTTK